MKITKVMLFAGVLMIIAIMTTGCISFKTSNKNTVDVGGGIFKTTNKGTVWKQKAAIPTLSGKPANFATIDVSALAMDPSDRRALYFGSTGSGLYYTYDGGDSWQKAAALGDSAIRVVTVAPDSKCVIYAAIGNRVVKSDDCSRSWTQKYIDDKNDTAVNTITVDHFNSAIIYLGVSRGDLIKSVDGGESWQTIHRFGDKIEQVLLDPDDSRALYVITDKKGLFRSEDSGANWSDLNEPIKGAAIGIDVKSLILIKGEPNKLFLATSQGIARSEDRGASWAKIELIPPEKKLSINAAVVNPKNTLEIYYVTNTTFNRSVDGGAAWTPVKLPSSRAGWRILIDPEEPNILYMGMMAPKKK